MDPDSKEESAEANEINKNSPIKEEDNQERTKLPPTNEIIPEELPLPNGDAINAYYEQAKPYLQQALQHILRLSKSEINNVSVSVIFFTSTSLTALVDKYMPFKIILFFLRMILHFILSTIGLAIAIALGVGFGAHIYETLDKHSFDAQKKKQLQEQNASNEKPKKSYSKSNYITSTSDNGDASYYTLMAKSGYHQPPKTLLLRGQIRPLNTMPSEQDYNIVGVRATSTMKQMWPNLSDEINQEFGMLIDYLVRDYVVSWFGSVDSAIVYRNPAKKGNKSNGETSENTRLDENENSKKKRDDSNIPQRIAKPERILTVSTAQYKSTPFLNTLTSALSHLIGQLCTTAADNVNVVDLVLIKIVKAMTKTLKHYRRARKVALLRQASFSGSKKKRIASRENLNSSSHADNSNGGSQTVESEKEISEIAITKELLISNKLHKAITFGLDVPSLLFADPKGIKAPLNDSEPSQHSRHEPIEDSVLHDRLYNTPLLAECELDYNRVISNKICRKIVPAADLSSPMIRSFAVEVVAGSLLTPIMGFFAPEVVNGYIIQGLESYINTSDPNINKSHEYVANELDDEMGFDSFSDHSIPNESKESIDGDKRKEEIETKNDKEFTLESKKNMPDDHIETTKHSARNYSNSFDEENTNHDMEKDINQGFDNDLNSERENRIDDDVLENDINNKAVDEDMNDAKNNQSESVTRQGRPEVEQVLPILTLAVIDVQNYGENLKDDEGEINWEHDSCRAAVCHLVLVIEAALQHGRRLISQHDNEGDDAARSSFGTSLIDFLMDMTMNIDAFEKSLKEKEALHLTDQLENQDNETLAPDAFKHESSTLRTMIVAWLQTGDIYDAIRVFTGSKKLRTYFYSSNAFFRNDDEAIAFCNQLKILDGIDILVDTMAVLEADSVKFDGESTDLNSESFNAPKALPQPSSSKLQRANIVEPTSEQTVMKQAQNHLPGQNQITMLASNMKANMKSNTKRLSRWVGVSSLNQTSELTTNTSSDNSKLLGSAKKTASNDYLDFHRNSNWTEKLRYERAQRTETWKKATISSAMTATGKFKMIDSVWSKNSEKIHRDLQYFARVIYGSTLSITIEKKDDLSEQTNFLLETVSARRMLEVPDDDSSLFLVKTVPRPLKPLRIWNDDQNQRNNFRIYSAFYEQPVTHPVTKRYNGGRLVRHCVVRFFLSDRSAIVSPSQSVSLFKAESARKICIAPYSSESTLTGKIRKEKNPCQKVLHRASSMSTVMMMGNLMEASDFVSTPRTGKAIEFVYKLAFFEKPTIEVLGKRFTVQDGNLKGAHRADASAIELSDASMTAAIILSGDDQEQVNVNDNSSISTTATPSLDLEVSEEKRIKPLNEHTSAQINTDCSIEHNKKRTENEILSVNIKVKNAGSDKKDLLRAFRPSFIRAILLVATARQEAQLQCLLWSIKSGSARQATKSRTEGLLQPTLALLQFANSKGRNKESILIRNLKFGSSHVEREKLRRSKILNPRYPTFLRGLNAKIEGWVKETSSDDGSVTFTYRIRCLALIESEFDDENIYVNNIIDNHDDTNEKSKSTDTGRKVYKEEWVITRSFREFMSLHKHLKTQMSTAAASGNATQRFAAATAAVFAAGSATNDNSHRKGLLLSLAHAAKIGALGATRKSLDKRTEILDEYLRHLLGPNNLLRRCSELMQFLGADTPLEFNHPRDFIDSLGRSETRRMEMNADLYPEIGASAQVLNNARSKRNETKIKASQKTATKEKNVDIQNQETTKQKSLNSVSDDNTTISSKNKKMKRDLKKLDQYAKLKKMIETVKLSDAREIIFEFIRYLFDLDNATFFRSRMVSALRTMSLVVTSSQEFNKVLLQMHIKYVNGKYIGSMVKSVYDSLWPNGVWYTAGPPMSEQEKKSLEARSKEALFKAFPEKVRTILGQEISEDGLSVLHEMLQNKVVMKSLGYMIMDTIWLEIFPELYDVLSGTEAVDDD